MKSFKEYLVERAQAKVEWPKALVVKKKLSWFDGHLEKWKASHDDEEEYVVIPAGVKLTGGRAATDDEQYDFDVDVIYKFDGEDIGFGKDNLWNMINTGFVIDADKAKGKNYGKPGLNKI
jgi:hypothetical protein